MALTRDDVLQAYLLFLGREPESEDAIIAKLQVHQTYGSLMEDMLTAPEFALRMRALHGRPTTATNPRCFVHMNASSEQMAQLNDHVRETWAELGRTSPHHSVLTGPEFRSEQMTAQREVEFYATGLTWADELANVLRRNDITTPPGLILDFGCGLGRVGEHLSARFERYLGVDISFSHLEIARARFAHLGRSNASFELLRDFLKSEIRVDMIYCVLVLQHNPPPIMLAMLNDLLSRLNPGGIAFIQIPTVIYDYNFEIGAYLNGIDKPKQMEMHALPQRHIFGSIKANECDLLEIYDDDCAGPLGDSFRFLIRKTARLD